MRQVKGIWTEYTDTPTAIYIFIPRTKQAYIALKTVLIPLFILREVIISTKKPVLPYLDTVSQLSRPKRKFNL